MQACFASLVPLQESLPVRRSWLRVFWAGLVVAGAAAGYLMSSGIGERLLHHEIETQLTRLLGAPVTFEEFDVHARGGLRLEARGVMAFGAPLTTRQPTLRARRIVAWIDVLALMIGRLELGTLVIESPRVRVQTTDPGEFDLLPLPRIAPTPAAPTGGLEEAWIARIERLDEAVGEMVERLRTTDRIEIHDGTVHWVVASGGEAPPRELRFELFEAVMEEHWLSGEISIDWTAVCVDGEHAPFPVQATLRQSDESSLGWSVTLSDVPLGLLLGEIVDGETVDELSGRVSTEIRVDESDEDRIVVHVSAEIEDLLLGLPGQGIRFERPRIHVSGDLDIGPKRLRLVGFHVEGQHLTGDLQGTVQRPIGPDSPARLATRLVGIELENIVELARNLGARSDSARSLATLMRRVEGGRILEVQASGATRLGHWQDLLTGRRTDLPASFVFGGRFEDVAVATEADDRITELRGEVEWAQDRLTLRHTKARFRDEPLPTLELVLDGVSHLALAPEEANTIRRRPPPLPGMPTLLELIKPRNPEQLPPVKSLGLALEYFEHPVFRWPMRDLKVLIEPLHGGVEVQVREGSLGGATVQGKLVVFTGADHPTLSASLELGPLPAAETPPPASVEPAPSNAGTEATTSRLAEEIDGEPIDRWASGRFEMELRPRPRIPFRHATGFIWMEGTELIGRDVELSVEPVGQLALRTVLGLERAGEVGVDLGFALTQGRLEHLSEFLVLPKGLARGGLGATGSLRGPVRSDEPIMRRIEGRVRAEARVGDIRVEVPLLLRLAKASEGYNPFAGQDELEFETMTATFDFDRGVLLTDDLEIEGPLRIYARGRIDMFDAPSRIRSVVGIFLFRPASDFLEHLPLVRYLLPGSERGLVGTYFEVEGPLREPEVEALPMATLMTAVPEAIKAPFKALQYLFDPSDKDS